MSNTSSLPSPNRHRRIPFLLVSLLILISTICSVIFLFGHYLVKSEQAISPGVAFSLTSTSASFLEPLPTHEVASTASNLGKPTVENVLTTVSSTPIQVTQQPPILITPSIDSGIPVVPESRLLILEWPPKLRVGDANILRLKLVMDEQGNLTPTAYIVGNALRNEPIQIPNLYATHGIIAEARLDLAGMQYIPTGEVSEALHPGQPVMFLWSLRATEVGTYRGTVWLHLRFIPLDGGVESRSVLSAQLVEIEAVNFLGLGGTAARVLGSVGVVVGSMLGLDGLLSWFWNIFKSLPKTGSNE